MRLLQRVKEDQYILTSRFVEGDTIPPYAILSHTWGKDGEEVTFQDVTNGDHTYKNKPGYDKIRFCGEQTNLDGLDFFWVDTACINKSDKAELADAIKSMFLWYHKAARCYVYLSDVSTSSTNNFDERKRGSWKIDFRKSRWFTRGWTLQELIAPTTLDFFSKEGERLGSRLSLVQQTHEITGIPCSALQGTPLSRFTIDERLSWKRDRQTKMEEDGAYSMLGLVDVDMSPLYGEGSSGAFRRLHNEIQKNEKCIQDIRGTDPRDDKRRIEDTKGGLLRDSYRWIIDNVSFKRWQDDPLSRLLWIKGDPGKGKTMLLCGVINELERSSAIISYFFCQATDSRINSATTVLRGLLYLLLIQQPSLVYHVRKKYDQAEDKAIFEDANAWYCLTGVFTSILQDPSLPTTYLIIDALDECTIDLPMLLDFIVQQSTTSTCVRWLVSSRNWPHIEEKLELADHKVRLSLELNAESVADAVAIFVQWKVSQLAELKKYDQKMREGVLDYMTTNANDTFLWVALVCQGLEKTSTWNVMKKISSFPPGLESLYQRMLKQISESDDDEVCRSILATVTLAYQPLTLEELTALTDALYDMTDRKKMIEELVGHCGSFLTIRAGVIYHVHQSAKDFILKEATEAVFPLGADHVHYIIFTRSIETMSRDLHRDMYSLVDSSCPIEEVTKPEPDPLAASRYSCVFWIDHICASNLVSLAESTIDAFLKKKYLYWLEALSLERRLPRCVGSMTDLRLTVQAKESAPLYQLIYDTYRFIMHNKAIIESFPLQTYVAALLFSPSNSLVKDLFRHEESKRLTVKPSLTNDWSACLQTLDIDDGRSGNSILSHNSTRLATATNAGIRIWDVSSGTYLRTLRIQERGLCMAFSYDSGWLAVATDSTKWVDIWDVNRGACLMKLQGHLEDVTAVAFSQHQLASGSWDGTIKIWDPNSGACLRTIETSSGLHTLGFSENRLLATRLGFFEVWDTHSCVCLSAHIMDGNYGRVVYSHDLTLLAVRWDSNIEIHHIDSGTCLQTLKSHGGWITSMAFSHDSSWVVSSSSDRAIRIWDVSSGACLQTFRSHSYRVVSLVGISHDSTRMVSASARRLEIWDTSSSTGSMSEPEQHTDTVCAMVFSRDSLLLATSSLDSTVKIWDSESGVCLQTLKGFDHLVCAIAFSYDSQKLVTGTYGRIVQIWSISDRGCASCLQTLHLAKDGNEYFCAALSADATQLLVGNYTGTVQVWNISTATCYRTFTVPDGRITCVALGGENNKLAYSIWDGKKSIVTILKVDSPWQQTFDMDKGPVHTLYFDNTCSYLHTEYGIVGHESRCLGLDINPDNKWVVHAGKNVLWIPTDCRSGEDSRHVCRSICGTRLAVSTETGKVWICTYTGQ